MKLHDGSMKQRVGDYKSLFCVSPARGKTLGGKLELKMIKWLSRAV